MSVNQTHIKTVGAGFRAGQAVAGLVIFIALIAVVTALARLPWGFVEPVLRFLGGVPLVNAALKAAMMLGVISVVVLFLIWLERKIAGWMQARLGPMHVGWKGLAQTLADAVKLLVKEDIIPTSADRPLFFIGPYLAFVPTLMTFMVLPFGAA